MDVIANQLFAGLSMASILLMIALGLAIIYGAMGVINLAHGEVVMLGAYATWALQSFGGIGILPALPLVFVAVAAVGWIIEKAVVQNLYHRPLDTLLVTFGVGLVLQQLARDIFGAPAKNVFAPPWLSGGIEIFGAVVPKTRLFILVLAIACVTALAVALKASPMGRRIRAVVQNRDLAETSGISSRRTDITTFFIGSGLAGVAGVALTLIGSTSPTIGQSYLIDAFLVVVVGGLIEVGAHYCTHRLADRLGQLNIPATFDFTETGTHSWPYWVEQLPKSWPTLAGSLGI